MTESWSELIRKSKRYREKTKKVFDLDELREFKVPKTKKSTTTTGMKLVDFIREKEVVRRKVSYEEYLRRAYEYFKMLDLRFSERQDIKVAGYITRKRHKYLIKYLIKFFEERVDEMVSDEFKEQVKKFIRDHVWDLDAALRLTAEITLEDLITKRKRDLFLDIRQILKYFVEWINNCEGGEESE